VIKIQVESFEHLKTYKAQNLRASGCSRMKIIERGNF